MNHRPLLAVAIAIATLTAGCSLDSEREQKHEREVSRLRNDILGMTEQLRKATTDLEVEKANRARADEEIKTTREKAEALRKELDAARTELLNYRREYQLQSRVRAVGQQFAELATVDGKTYQQARIRAVLVDSVQISHADGQAKIALANLGPQWLKRFDVGTGNQVCLIDEATLKEACARAAKSQ